MRLLLLGIGVPLAFLAALIGIAVWYEEAHPCLRESSEVTCTWTVMPVIGGKGGMVPTQVCGHDCLERRP